MSIILPKSGFFSSMDEVSELKKLYEECGQGHVLKYWDELTEENQEDFLKHLSNIDLKGALNLWEKARGDLQNTEVLLPEEIIPIEVESELDFPPNIINEYRTAGLNEILKGTVAVIVLSGGQGTRLGMSYPKGLCPTGLPSGKTIFQLLAERIQRVVEIAQIEIGRTRLTNDIDSMSESQTGPQNAIRWYIMTSEPTYATTQKFFVQNNYFGLDKNCVKFFVQDHVPCFDLDGKLLMEEKNGVALAPDGNGGLFKALKDSRMLEDMDRHGVKYVHAHSVDNILVKVADPVFIGKCVIDKVDCALKVIKKENPLEPLGLVVIVRKDLKVVEYTEMPKNAVSLKTPSGDLLYNTGNICNYFFTADFLKLVALEHEQDMRIHIAKKIHTQLGPEGEKMRPAFPNCIKLEKFIFDSIEFSDNFLAWQVARDSEFSPVKNSDVSKVDNFVTAKRDLMTLHKRWVEEAGGVCQGMGLEVSPLVSYEGEGLGHVKGAEFREGEVLRSPRERE